MLMVMPIQQENVVAVTVTTDWQPWFVGDAGHLGLRRLTEAVPG